MRISRIPQHCRYVNNRPKMIFIDEDLQKVFLKRIRAKRQTLKASLRWTKKTSTDVKRIETLEYKIELLNCIIAEFTL